MKKILLSALVLSSALITNAQNQPELDNYFFDEGAKDDFLDADVNDWAPGIQEYSAEDTTNFGWDEDTDSEKTDSNAYKGMFWTEATGDINGFVATKDRDGSGVLKYSITQTQGNYEPFLMVFGSYSDNGTKTPYTIDLSENANVSFTVKNAGDSTIKFTVQLQDINGKSLVYDEGVDGNEGTYYNYNIGYAEGDSDPMAAGDENSFDYDFANAIEGCPNPVKDPDHAEYDVNADDLIATNSDDCDEDFDYTQVTAITFTVVNSANTGNVSGTHDQKATDYLPLLLTEYPIEISNFAMGKEPVGLFNNAKEEASFSIFPNPSANGVTNFSTEVSNLTVVDALGNVVETATNATELNTSSYEAGLYILKSDQGSVKLVVE